MSTRINPLSHATSVSLSFEKLRRLWKIRPSVVDHDSPIKRRAEQIYHILERWERDKDSLLAIEDHGSPDDENIPTDSWNTVKERLRKFYDRHPDLKGHVGQVDEVADLLHLQDRDGRFRVSSNAASDYERRNTEPTTFSAPETHFGSHNFPFEIIKFFFSCNERSPFATLRYFRERRFIPKFIWMVATRENVIPIFSLRSFRELSPLFRTLEVDVDWGDRVDRWELPLSDFVSVWPQVSNQLCRHITDREYSALNNKEKRELALLLFIASVSETTTKNAFDMIQTGNRAMILYGPPGTGKTYIAQRLATQLLIQQESKENARGPAGSGSPEATLFEKSNFTKVFGDTDSTEPSAGNASSLVASPFPKLTHGCWELVQFHPSYSYHDFIGGIMPDVKGDALSYTKKEGIFKRFCDAARVNSDFPFILIIDEINRADLSSVFGELMYALEYRDSPVNTLQFGRFSIPRNVYLIGTMNTADKSLVTFDLALRRRFLFMKLMPDLNTLYDWNSAEDFRSSINTEELNAFIFSANNLNKALVAKPPEGLGLPEDYGIGQAYFMKIRDFCVPEDDGSLHITEFARERLWDYHIEPLVEEYLGAEAKNWKSQITDLRTKFTKQKESVE